MLVDEGYGKNGPGDEVASFDCSKGSSGGGAKITGM